MVMDMETALTQFIQWGASRYSPRTLYTYRILVNRFVEYVKPETMVKEITLDEFNDYYTYLKHLKLADSSIAYHLIALRQMWFMLFKTKQTRVDYELINVPKYTQQSYPAKGIEEGNKLLAKVWGDDVQAVRDRLIISFLVDSGVRVSELCDLRMSELRIADRYAVIISKKNRKKRTIFWYERTEVYLAQYLGYWRELAHTDRLLITLDRKCPGQSLTTRSVERIIAHYAKLADLGWITPHMFRHGLGEALSEERVHPRHMQLILGHKNITGTQTYLDVSDPDLLKVYKQFASSRI